MRGIADFLVRVPEEATGDAAAAAADPEGGDGTQPRYEYEVWDAKLGLTPQPKAIAQVCAYALIVRAVCGVRVRRGVIVTGSGAHFRFNIDDYVHYVTVLLGRYVEFLNAFSSAAPVPPVPASKSLQGNFTEYAADELRRADAVQTTAKLTSGQVGKLQAIGVSTLTGLAAVSAALSPKKVVYLPVDAPVPHKLAGPERTQVDSWLAGHGLDPLYSRGAPAAAASAVGEGTQIPAVSADVAPLLPGFVAYYLADVLGSICPYALTLGASPVDVAKRVRTALGVQPAEQCSLQAAAQLITTALRERVARLHRDRAASAAGVAAGTPALTGAELLESLRYCLGLVDDGRDYPPVESLSPAFMLQSPALLVRICSHSPPQCCYLYAVLYRNHAVSPAATL